MSIINKPCYLARAGKTRIVTPRRRTVQGGRWTVENGRRRYHVNTRWQVEYIVRYLDWRGVAHIVVATDFASTWELTPVGSVELEEAA